jgi:hypothetical protein
MWRKNRHDRRDKIAGVQVACAYPDRTAGIAAAERAL